MVTLVILYSARLTDIPAVGTNGPDPIFPSSQEAVLCADEREKIVGGKIFVRRRTLLIREWLRSWVEWLHLSNLVPLEAQ